MVAKFILFGLPLLACVLSPILVYLRWPELRFVGVLFAAVLATIILTVVYLSLLGYFLFTPPPTQLVWSMDRTSFAGASWLSLILSIVGSVVVAFLVGARSLLSSGSNQ